MEPGHSMNRSEEEDLMDKNIEMSFQFAQDTAKHLVTLATVTIAFTVTFSKDFLPSSVPKHHILVITAWLAFLASVMFGQWCLMALTGRLTAKDKRSIYHPAVKLPAVLQVFSFGIGLVAVVVFAIMSLS